MTKMHAVLASFHWQVISAKLVYQSERRETRGKDTVRYDISKETTITLTWWKLKGRRRSLALAMIPQPLSARVTPGLECCRMSWCSFMATSPFDRLMGKMDELSCRRSCWRRRGHERGRGVAGPCQQSTLESYGRLISPERNHEKHHWV